MPPSIMRMTECALCYRNPVTITKYKEPQSPLTQITASGINNQTEIAQAISGKSLRKTHTHAFSLRVWLPDHYSMAKVPLRSFSDEINAVSPNAYA